MKQQASRGARGKRVRQSTGPKKNRGMWQDLRNPLTGDPRKDANAQVTVKGASIFLGISLKF